MTKALMVVPPLRALGLTLQSVVTTPRAENVLEPRAQEGLNPHLSAPGGKSPNPNPAPPMKNLHVHLPLADRFLIPLPEETQWAHKGLGAPETGVVTEALEVVGIPEVNRDRRIGVESAPHLGKGAAVAVTAELNLTQDTATTVPAPLTVEEDKEHFFRW